MRLLLHICCAPCSIACIDTLQSEGIDLTGFWYNPNIHPYTEYRQRLNTLTDYAASLGLSLIRGGSYDLRGFLTAVGGAYDRRCGVCYRLRMEETARFAAENGYDGFSTTLLISPYQNHELLKKTAEEAAEKYGTSFVYRDFRPRFREGQDRARELGLYMQKYCGCIFSEEERYRKKKKARDLREEREQR